MPRAVTYFLGRNAERLEAEEENVEVLTGAGGAFGDITINGYQSERSTEVRAPQNRPASIMAESIGEHRGESDRFHCRLTDHEFSGATRPGC